MTKLTVALFYLWHNSDVPTALNNEVCAVTRTRTGNVCEVVVNEPDERDNVLRVVALAMAKARAEARLPSATTRMPCVPVKPNGYSESHFTCQMGNADGDRWC